jgi:hypothetical protein
MFEDLDFFGENFGLTREGLLRKLSSQLGVEYDGGEIKVAKGDRTYLMYFYFPQSVGSKVGTQYFFEIKTKIPFPHQSSAVRKSEAFDWFLEHILLMPDFHVGESDFDRKFYVKVSDPDWGREFFDNSDTKETISDLLLKNYDMVRSEDGDLKLVKFGTFYPNVEIINYGIEHMERILSGFSKTPKTA